MGIEIILNALAARNLKRTGEHAWMARCPSHDDAKASLSVGRGEDGRALLKCQAGCEITAIVADLRLQMADLFPKKPRGDRPGIAATYDYRDEAGALLYQVVRFDPKDFRQRKPGGPSGWTWKLEDARRVLYRLPELIEAHHDLPVFVVEGEKDADALAAMGLVATTNVGGAGKWRPEYSAFLKDRDVTILPDNDDPGRTHAQDVAEAIAMVAASVRIVNLPGLPAKGDVSDWLKAGGTREQLTAMADAGEPTAPRPSTFITSAERMVGERADRLETGKRMLQFGVKFLDDAMVGIAPRDLVLLGAKTGIGKTQLAMSIALHNVVQGKRVHYFALEAEYREIERRMKYQAVVDRFYGDPNRPYAAPADVRSVEWMTGALDGHLAKYEEAAERDLALVLRGLRTFYRERDFTSDDFAKRLDEVKDETDLVILDHLHYIDTDDTNENRGYKRIVKQIRDAALHAGKPVIVVAHVRKGDRRLEPLVPTIEDFHGSSDISKIATKAVMIAPAYEQPQSSLPYLWRTYMQIVKCRQEGSVTRYAALTSFNARSGRYEPFYALGRLTDAGRAFSDLSENDTPSWARRSRMQVV